MKRFLSISVLLRSITAAMALILIAICAVGAERAYERRAVAERVLHIVRVSRDLFTTLQEVRLERGGINAALAMPNPVPVTVTPSSTQRHLEAQRAFTDAVAQMQQDPDPGSRQAVADLLDRQRDFLAARDAATAALKLPRAQRPPGVAARWVAADNAMVAAAGGRAHDLSAEVSGDDPVVAELMKMKQLVWWARDAAGQDSMMVGAAQAAGARLTPEQQQALAVQAGRSDEAWMQVRDEARMPTLPPQVEAAVATAGRVFYGDYNRLRDQIVAELATGAPMTFTRQDEMTAAVRGLDALMAISTAAFDASEVHARQELAAADRDLTLAVVLMGLSFGLGLAAFHFISRRVVEPIRRITDAMGEVASGELEQRVPYQDRGDEIGRLARALSVFRRNAMEKRRVELALNRSQVAVEAAEAASRLKSQFLANMSHEIRTPLNGVLGMVQVMEQEAASELQRERLATIRDSGKALLQILNDVLDLSKIEAGEFDLHPAEFTVTEVAHRTCAAFSGAAEAKGLKLTCQVESGTDGVWLGDAARLRQIISNLLSNALKFTDAGQVSLTVKRRKHGIAFLVRDTGIGISAEALPKLFGKFSQVDDSNTRRFGGTGLGLAISRELSQMMGGDIQVSSTPGEGSVFCVTLPLTRLGDQPAAKASAGVAKPGVALDHAVRILAAEDNATNQKVLAALLSPLGVDLTVVADGKSAVEAWRAGGFDVVLMDIQMPVMSGVAAAEAIRKLEAAGGLAPTPIIALSANAMSHQIESYLKAGMTAHVAKPIEAGLLFAAIEAALDAQDEPAARAFVA